MWKKGPLPAGTFFWGGVVLHKDKPVTGFHFADFRGDHVILCPGDTRVEAHEVRLYANCLELPDDPEVKGRVGSPG